MSRITEHWISRADRLEDYWRDFAFLGLTETLRIGGRVKAQGAHAVNSIEVQQLTLRMFVQLCAVKSPFLVGGRVGPEHVAQILWRLSPEYWKPMETACPQAVADGGVAAPNIGEPSPRQRFVASIAELPFQPTVRAITRYLDRMLSDKPPSQSKKKGTKPDTSFAASVIHQLANAYGWCDEQILDLPMPRLFQYMRKIQRASDPDLAYFNPLRDRFVQKITNKVLEARRVKAEAAHAAGRVEGETALRG